MFGCYTNNLRQNAIEVMKQVNIDNNHIDTSENSDWGFEKKGDNLAKIISPEIITNRNELTYSIIFTDNGCRDCVENEVKNINELYSKYKNKFSVYLMSNNNNYLTRLYGADFSYKNIDPSRKIINNDFIFSNPIAIISNPNNNVLYIHVAEKDDDSKSNLFYSQLDSLFSY